MRDKPEIVGIQLNYKTSDQKCETGLAGRQAQPMIHNTLDF